MNRAERRKQGIKKPVPSYNITREKLEKVMEAAFKEKLDAAREEALKYATDRTVASFVICLHDKFGFGKERIQHLLDYVSNTFECVAAETVTLDELVQGCEDMGITITDRKPVEEKGETNNENNSTKLQSGKH